MLSRLAAATIVASAIALLCGHAWAHCTEPGTCHDAFDDCVDAPVGFWSDGEICWPCVAGEFARHDKKHGVHGVSGR